MDIQDKIEQLDKELSEATNLIFNKKKGAVDIKKCQELLADIKRALPSSIQEASYIISQKESIIAQAEAKAEKTKAEAHFKKALSLSLTHVNASFLLGVVLYEQNK